ncbi:prephenate dehydrogenase/arogenate dehydrogenase family protein [Amycolatopsis balhimycina DSM 5908]|uniref:Prephenate dehydrogenase/arogenate dehydrogenase family protein n=2 Tax=Amycolatopsis balhimycina TaxID=208443 RepID=A0A428X5R7_AMYBA|nr:prephenate dehydrogenase [Amycolatopsis balhimycina]RSM50661.1 prephenate dehydrogenase/arogenate dehydrogenase family protein [Amycolatopsis balhimycina DSM 5908]CAG25755.1 putative prephenate dehydrogenase [Amycolatopsis balhimycina DSM 5908]
MTIEKALVVGTGLIGTSVALALREKGVAVFLSDVDTEAARLAQVLGAGREWAGEGVDLAVIAVPPHLVGDRLADLQKQGAARVYTDVASVKADPIADAERLGCDLASYVPGHPLAGRERSGPAAARAELFSGRPWALCPGPETDAEALRRVRELVSLCGATAVVVGAGEHDSAVALVSHAPHVVASAVAASLASGDDVALGLAGQGLRDVTRIAAGDPLLWRRILSGNTRPVAGVLERIAADLAAAASALRSGDLDEVTDLLRRGVDGHGRIPGQRGGSLPGRNPAGSPGR